MEEKRGLNMVASMVVVVVVPSWHNQKGGFLTVQLQNQPHASCLCVFFLSFTSALSQRFQDKPPMAPQGRRERKGSGKNPRDTYSVWLLWQPYSHQPSLQLWQEGAAAANIICCLGAWWLHAMGHVPHEHWQQWGLEKKDVRCLARGKEQVGSTPSLPLNCSIPFLL